MSKNPKKMIKIVNIDGENLHIFWKTWEISKTFSGKIRLIAILKVTKNQGFNLSLEGKVLEKPQRRVKLTPQPFKGWTSLIKMQSFTDILYTFSFEQNFFITPEPPKVLRRVKVYNFQNTYFTEDSLFLNTLTAYFTEDSLFLNTLTVT